jgi:RimJ/RimL family protein N-acetyltransferase
MTVFLFSSPLRAAGSVLAPIRDGVATLRPLGAGEGEPLEAVFAQLSDASRADRYLTGLHRLTGPMRAALTAVDGRDHVAWLAEVDGRPAALGRFIRVDPCTAEIAFEVVDAHQGRGLGTVLLDTLTTVAGVCGVQRLRASVLPANHRSRRLLGRIGMTFRAEDGLLEGVAPLRLLDPPVVDRPAVVSIALAGHRAAA